MIPNHNGFIVVPTQGYSENGNIPTNILDLIPALISYMDKDLRYVYINAAYEKWIGISAKEIVGKNLVDIIGIEAYNVAKPDIDEVLLGRQVRYERNLFYKTRNKLQYLDVCLTPDFDDNGKVRGFTSHVNDITDKKKTEKELQDYVEKELLDSEKEHRKIMQLLPVAIYTCDKEGKIKLYNEAAVKLWGREPEIGKDYWSGSWKIYDPETGQPLSLAECPMAVALKECREVKGKEIIIERPDGVRRHLAPNPKPIFDGKGNLLGAVNILFDITDQKNSQRALSESEERFRMMTDLIPIIIWLTDAKGNCTYLNTKWSESTGMKAEHGYGSGWADYIHPDEKDVTYNAWLQCFSKKEPYDIKFRYLNARDEYIIHHAIGNPRYSETGEFLGYIGIFQDVTAQEKTKFSLEKEVLQRTEALNQINEQLRRSEQLYHRMIAEVQDYSIILLSKEGNIENWNKGAEKIKGYSTEEILGKNFRIFYPQEDQQKKIPEKLIKEAIQNGKALHEGLRVRKDGSTFWGSTIITALHDENNQIIGFSKVTRDLSEMKATEDALKANALKLKVKNKELERMNDELTSFAYVSSHDLQEPLRKIQTFTSRILEIEEGKFSEKGKDYFNRIQSAASRMRKLIEDLLVYSRTNTTERKFISTDLNKLLFEVKNEIKELIEEKNASIESSLLPRLNIIPFQFHQLIVNLLTNALKFSKKEVAPRILISSDIVKGDQINSVLADFAKSYNHIMISDNGIGFEPEYNARIFEVFQRLHSKSEYSGTGIGLAICKKIIENHNGIITAEGEINKGATFHIYLPENN